MFLLFSWSFVVPYELLYCFFSKPVKYDMGILIGITLIAYINFGRIDIFTTLILPIYKHGIFFHHIVSPMISLANFLRFSRRGVSLSWVDIPKYLMKMTYFKWNNFSNFFLRE